MPTKKNTGSGFVVEMREITPEFLNDFDEDEFMVFNPHASGPPSFEMTKEQAKKILDETKVGNNDDFIAKFRVAFEKLAGKKLNDMEVSAAFMRAMELASSG